MSIEYRSYDVSMGSSRLPGDGHGVANILVDSTESFAVVGDATIRSHADSDVTIFSPSRSPGVADSPVRRRSSAIVTSSNDGMVH
jgi:hypothetical protein